jgi:hypothetical protein
MGYPKSRPRKALRHTIPPYYKDKKLPCATNASAGQQHLICTF